jgi:predicted RNA-binding Zn-ribbon protein involved in translation (DUF1610 family)
MNLNERLRRVRCNACSWQRVWGPEEMQQQLRAQGQLRRAPKPEPDLVLALLERALPNLPCPDCGDQKLSWSTQLEDFDDWGDVKRCELCKQVIPAERLEIFPKSTRCAACQDQPTPATHESDYCPRCGGLLQLRRHSGSGLSRYIVACSDCGFRG